MPARRNRGRRPLNLGAAASEREIQLMKVSANRKGQRVTPLSKMLLAALRNDLESKRLERAGYTPAILDLVSPDHARDLPVKHTLIRLLERDHHVQIGHAARQFTRNELHESMADLNVPTKDSFLLHWLKPLEDIPFVRPGASARPIELDHSKLAPFRKS